MGHHARTFESSEQNNIQCQIGQFVLTFSFRLPPSHFPMADVIESYYITQWEENTCFCSMRLSLYKVTELNLIWCKMRALTVGRIKLTRNSFVNETDKRTNQLLSKMSPIVIKKNNVHLWLTFSFNEVSCSVEWSQFQNRFFRAYLIGLHNLSLSILSN